MFAESESEELLNLLSQVRLVADEEERTDYAKQQQQEQQQQQQQQLYDPATYAAKSFPSSAQSMSTASAAGPTANSTNAFSSLDMKAFSPISAGRYTASSTVATTTTTTTAGAAEGVTTAATSWTVHDSSRSPAGQQQQQQQQLPDARLSSMERDDFSGVYHENHNPALRTPATGAKVLQGIGRDGFDDEGGYDELTQPKQLFFMDAHKRNILRQQQQQQQQQYQQYELSSPSSPFTPHDTPAGLIRTPAITRNSNVSPAHTASMRSGGGNYSSAASPTSYHNNNNKNNNTNVAAASVTDNNSCSSVTFTAGQRSGTTSTNPSPRPSTVENSSRPPRDSSNSNFRPISNISHNLNAEDGPMKTNNNNTADNTSAEVTRGSFPRTASRQAVASAVPGGAAVLSTVLSGYAASTSDGDGVAEDAREDRELHGAYVDGLSRIAAELERAAADEDDGDRVCNFINNNNNNYDSRVARAGAGFHRDPVTSTERDVWTPGQEQRTPHPTPDRAMRSPYGLTSPFTQQQQQQQPLGKPQSFALSSTSSSPLFPSASAAAAATAGGRPSNFADASALRGSRSSANGNSTVTTPLSVIPPAIPRTRQQQQQQQQGQYQASPLAPMSTDAAVVNFFRVSSAAPEGGSGLNYYSNSINNNNNNTHPADGSPRTNYNSPFYTANQRETAALVAGVPENDASWRLSVEAELNDLQRAGTNNNNNNTNNVSSGVHKHGTPTTTISPLTASATTPYHQLLSQMRYSPQQGHAAAAMSVGGDGAGGVAARANTPPDRRAFSASQPQPLHVPRAAVDALRGSGGDGASHAAALASAGPLFTAGGASRYTANVTRVSPFTDVAEGSGRTPQSNLGLSSTGHTGGSVAGRGWPRSSPCPTDAAALWERMSPYEKAAAAAAAAAAAQTASGRSSNAAGALFHTPDTVAKPVTLSSIAAHLHRGGEVDGPVTPDGLNALGHPEAVRQFGLGEDGGFGSQWYPSPPAFTTAASHGGSGAVMPIPSPASLSQRPGSATRLSDAGMNNGGGGGGSSASTSLFPPSQQQQQQQPVHGWTKQISSPTSTTQGPHASPRSAVGAVAAAASATAASGISANAAPRVGRTGLLPTPHQQPSSTISYPSPPSLHRQGSPVDTVASTAAANNNNNTNSPPSCSLRPSPQMRGSDGSSPALRRYVITTPNTRANTAAGGGNMNANANSAGRRSNGNSPFSGSYSNYTTTGGGGGGGVSLGGSAREARPRVQLSHMSNTAASLRSPLTGTTSNNNNTPASGMGAVSYGASGNASPFHNSSSNTVGGGVAQHAHGMTPPYHSHGPSVNGTGASVSGGGGGGAGTGFNAAGNYTSATSGNGGAAASVAPAAVATLIERLRAIAPAVLASSPHAAAAMSTVAEGGAATSTAAEGSGFAALPPMAGATNIPNSSSASNSNSNNNSSSSAANNASSNGGGSLIPDVASASVIVAMSHDQHGCRLLQAVLDAECEGADFDSSAAAGENESSEAQSRQATGPYALEDSPNYGGGRRDVNTYQSNNNNNSAANAAAERRRQRRAEAFNNSVAVQVILRAIEPKLDAVMADGYGNFLLQKVFDMAPDGERQRLLRLPSLQLHLCEVACSPHGTFAVQRLVETVRNTEEERLVFVALERDLLRLLTNANGGHVLMKVMECIRRQYTALTNSAAGAVMSESASTPVQEGEVGLNARANADNNNDNNNNSSNSNNNTESVSKCSSPPPLRSLLQDRVDALFTAMQQNLLFVCQHKQGCCIVQKCLDFLNACSGLTPNTTSAAAQSRKEEGEEKGSHDHTNSNHNVGSAAAHQTSTTPMDYFERMSALLLPHVQELSVHPFGNYVVTRLVDVCYARGSTTTIDAVAAIMQGELVRMCTNKFASNVVEHILRHCSERRIRAICQALMTRQPNPSALSASTAAMLSNVSGQMSPVSSTVARLPLTMVVMDSYGNYVIQTLLTVAPVDELVSPTSVEGGMLPVLQQLLPFLSSRNFGRKLETKTELAVLRVEQYQQQQRRRV